MDECIRISRQAASEGELPFACVICKDGEIVVTVDKVFTDYGIPVLW